jgi:hypothetical protein
VNLRTWALALATLVACRFGGPSADPKDYVTFPEDGGADASTSSHAGPPSPVDDGGGADPDVSTSAGDDSGGPASDDSATDDSTTNDGGGGGDGAGQCGATVPVCDPIHNTGCNPFQQCDVDPTQKTAATGLCLFYSGSDASGACMSTGITESCPAKETCVSGACRALCLCNADCAPGQCCTDTSSAAPFKLCQACP